MELVEELVDHRDRELVLGRLVVEGAVVDAEAPRVDGFLDKQHRCRERRRARPDDALRQHGGTLALELILLQLGVAVWPNRHWCRPGQKVDPVVVGAGRW
jgi:hypothetical protein